MTLSNFYFYSALGVCLLLCILPIVNSYLIRPSMLSGAKKEVVLVNFFYFQCLASSFFSGVIVIGAFLSYVVSTPNLALFIVVLFIIFFAVFTAIISLMSALRLRYYKHALYGIVPKTKEDNVKETLKLD